MSMTLEELGQLLRAEREKKALSVDDVADGLKISSRVLRALEAGDSASLPQAVYVRGFISAYGKFLELDVQEILATVVLQDDVSDMPRPSGYESVSAPQPSKKKSLWPVFLLLLILAAVGGAAWFFKDAAFLSELKNTQLSAAEPAPALPTEKKPEPIPAANVQGQDAQKKPAVNAAAPVAAKKPEQKEAQKPAEAAVKKETQKPAAQQKAVTASASTHAGPHKVIITALSSTWIHSAADGGSRRQFSLKPGDTFALTFDDSLQLTLGNAGGVRIHFNGKEVSALGRNGEEKTVTFPPQM